MGQIDSNARAAVIPHNRRFRRDMVFTGDSQSDPWWPDFILQKGPPSHLLTGGGDPTWRRPLTQEGWFAGGWASWLWPNILG